MNQLLDKFLGNHLPITSTAQACQFANYFNAKIEQIYSDMFHHNCNTLDVEINVAKSSCASKFKKFESLSLAGLKAIIESKTSKTCDLDPLTSSIFKKCIDLLLPAIHHIVNLSLSLGYFPDVLKKACVTTLIKNENLDNDNMKNFRPVSNLPFLGKIIEKCVFLQINTYLCENSLYGYSQSAYRSSYSCETALVKIYNDILSILDAKSNAVDLLFDLSAAFDTVKHDLLLSKLSAKFGFSDVALEWFSTYLNNRSYFVKGAGCTSHAVDVKSGVPQGSISGPVLFNLYFKSAALIAISHGLFVHSYVDDMQCYLSFDKDLSVDMIKNKIRAFLQDLRHWMPCNFLKLNENKTKVIEILSNRNIESRIISNVQIGDSCSLPMPNDFVKILGIIFDDRLNLEKHINKVVSTCYANLSNLSRIASKLTKHLKVQLVYSLILPHIVYCNALFYNLPEYLLRKLTKVLYSAVRFIFGLRGSGLRMHMLPYLKSLHFLPAKLRIEFKMALLTHKCLHGYAPTYLKNLINSRSVSERHNLRVNDDFWLLQTVTSLNLARSQSTVCFRVHHPRYEIRCHYLCVKLKLCPFSRNV